MSNLYLEYPRCTTCKKAKKWLIENNVNFLERDITIQNPTVKELDEWIKKSGLPIKKFFNTSGVLYKQLNLKDKLKDMSYEQQLELLATDGKLVKRPLLISVNQVLVGFKQDEWENLKK